jgi:hypothetical protein
MNKKNCLYCEDSGLISMTYNHYDYTFKCKCNKGDNLKIDIEQWEGTISQIVSKNGNKKKFVLHQSYRDRIEISK